MSLRVLQPKIERPTLSFALHMRSDLVGPFVNLVKIEYPTLLLTVTQATGAGFRITLTMQPLLHYALPLPQYSVLQYGPQNAALGIMMGRLLTFEAPPIQMNED